MATQFKCLDDPPVILKQKMCLNAVSKNMKGELEPHVKNEQKCEKPKCLTLKTGHSLKLAVSPHKCDSKLGKLLDGVITVERLISAFEQDGSHRGFHAGDFTWKGSKFVAVGRMSGMTNEGTHRKPIFADCQQCDERGVMEGRICGQITETGIEELKGCQIFGAYRIRFDPTQEGGKGSVAGVIEGVLICSCT
jgi:hypothetical protein